ncbi:MAG: 50S ribosomal protein L21, partial [Candidatus Pacebacteria bacterium]|nr:50S ribosomal protein L21 [Candidatus Paceibacterota bacterium]
MKYAIIQLQGKQFQVSEGDQITVDRLDKDEGDKFSISDVLLLVDEDKRKIGQPIVKGAKVE